MIELYSKENCGACVQAKMIMDENKIEYKEIIITPENIEEYNLTTAPTIFKNNERMDGYHGYDKLLQFLK